MDTDYKKKLSGVFTPNVTPFLNEEVAYDKIVENIEQYNQTKLKGYMPLGSNGEFRSLTDEESIKIIDVYQKYISPEKTLIAGVMRESAKATIEFIKKIIDKGVDFGTILLPHYFVKCMTEEALIKYYITIADQSPIPIMMYNAPKFTAGLLISPHMVSVLAEHPNIAGMKDTSKEDISIYVNAVPKGANFYVLAGTINKLYAGLNYRNSFMRGKLKKRKNWMSIHVNLAKMLQENMELLVLKPLWTYLAILVVIQEFRYYL